MPLATADPKISARATEMSCTRSRAERSISRLWERWRRTASGSPVMAAVNSATGTGPSHRMKREFTRAEAEARAEQCAVGIVYKNIFLFRCQVHSPALIFGSSPSVSRLLACPGDAGNPIDVLNRNGSILVRRIQRMEFDFLGRTSAQEFCQDLAVASLEDYPIAAAEVGLR